MNKIKILTYKKKDIDYLWTNDAANLASNMSRKLTNMVMMENTVHGGNNGEIFDILKEVKSSGLFEELLGSVIGLG